MYSSPLRKRKGFDDQQMEQYLTPEQNKQGQNLVTGDHNGYSHTTEKQSELSERNVNFFSPQPNREQYQDRFIPCRTTAISKCLFGLMTSSENNNNSSQKKNIKYMNSPTQVTNPNLETQYQTSEQVEDEENLEKQKNYSNMLQNQLLFGENSSSKKILFDNDENSHLMDEQSQSQNHFNVLRFKTQEKSSLTEEPQISIFGLPSNLQQNLEKKSIQRQPTKVLDAPGLIDDFYIDVLDWSQQTQSIAIALSDSIYLWDPKTGEARNLARQPNYPLKRYTSLKFRPQSNQIAVSNSEGLVTIFDTETFQQVQKFQGNKETRRIGTMSFNSHNILATGGKDGHIYLWDVRQQSSILQVKAHRQEVCGLSWSPNDNCLASGGNDNQVLIYNLTASKYQNRFGSHKAAIRALDWSPHQSGVLITGGGSKDQTICVWNTLLDTLIKQIQVDSQVCKLMYSKNSQQFVSTHGFEKNEIIIWNSRDLTKQSTLHGHDKRVLYLSLSPDAQTIVTGSHDETLKFWRVFPPKKNDHPISQLQFSIQDLR